MTVQPLAPSESESVIDEDWPASDYTFVFNGGAESVTFTYTPQPIPAQAPVITYPAHGQSDPDPHGPGLFYRVFDGNALLMFRHLVDEGELSDEQMQELQRLISRKRKEKTK